MRKFTKIVSTGLLGVALLAGSSGLAFAEEAAYGSAGVSADKSYSLEEMLTYAIQDEYMAQAEYDAIMDAYGSVRPFSNIIKSEGTHINLLLPLFKTYNIPVPDNDAVNKTVVPDSLTVSYEAGVEAEVKNIAMYERFLKEDLPADVKAVFERLVNSSENHLKAFEKSANGATGRSLSNGNMNNGTGGKGNGKMGNRIDSGEGSMSKGVGNGQGEFAHKNNRSLIGRQNSLTTSDF